MLSNVEGERQPQFRLSLESEFVRHYPDDRPAFAFHRDRPPDQLRITAETAPPQAFAQDHSRWGAIRVFLGREGATERRPDAERRKQIGGDERCRQSLRLAPSCEVDVIESISGDLIKHFRLIAPVQIK